MMLTLRTFIAAILILLSLSLTARAQYSARDENGRYHFVAEFMARSWAVEESLPTYPDEALAKCAQGTAVVRVRLDPEGRVVQVKVPPDINPLLRKAAVAAAKRWRFEMPVGIAPLAEDGYMVIFRLTFSFRIEGGAGRVEMLDPPPLSRDNALMRVYDKRLALPEWRTWRDADDYDD